MIPAVVNVGIGYVTRDSPPIDFEFITYRDYVGVSTALLLFVALDGARRHLPRPAPTGAAADLRPAADRRRLRVRQGRRDRADRVRLRVPPPGRAVRRPDARAATARSTTSPVTPRCSWQVPVAVALLAVYYAAIGVAISSLTGRRIVAGAAFIGLLLVTSIVSAILVGDTRVRRRIAAGSSTSPRCRCTSRDLVFLGHIDPEARSAAWRGGLLAVVDLLGRAAVGSSSLRSLPVGGAMTPDRRRTRRDPAFAPDATVEVRERVGVVRTEGGAHRAVVLLRARASPVCSAPTAPARRRLMRAITGLLPVNAGTSRVAGATPSRSRRAAEHRAGPRGRGRARRGHARAARALRRRPPSGHRPGAPERALATVDLLDVADRAVGGFSKGMRQRAKVAAALVTDPPCWCSTSR